MHEIPFELPISPMEAKVRTSWPEEGWAFEPKWDGFRAIAGGGEPRLDSRNKRPLLRYFPELVAVVASIPAGTVIDAESFSDDVRRPGSASRWSHVEDRSWVPVTPGVVIEVSYDQLTGDRFRHATRFERWRPEKDPLDCTFEQPDRPGGARVSLDR